MTVSWWLTLATASVVVARPGLARADEPPRCPPDEWFCDDSSAEPSDTPGGEELPDGAASEEAPSSDRWPGSSDDDDAIDVRRPPPSKLDSGWSEGSGGRGESPWGLAMRVQGVLLDGKRRGEDAHLGGVGISGRYALNEVVTLDLGLDSIVGTDYNGYDRAELALSFSSLFFLNYHPVFQSYLLVGLSTSRARVDVAGDDQTWGYFGGHAGIGLDIVLDPRVAFNFDILAFMRGRTDSRAEREPEFTDERGRVTNTSGGGLLRGGVTLRF